MTFFRDLPLAVAMIGLVAGEANADTFYVSSFADDKVVKIAADGTVTDFSGGFGRPYGLAFDSTGSLYVAGSETNRVHRLLTGGTKTSFAKLATDGMTALAFDRDGALFVASQNDSLIVRVSRSAASTVYAAKLPSPFGLAFDVSGSLYVAYWKNGFVGRVDQVQPDGSIVAKFGPLRAPRGLAFDAEGNLFIADYGTGQIRKAPPSGPVTTFASDLSGPSGIAFDSHGDLYVVNEGSGTVVRITPDGQVHPFASGLHLPLYLAVEPEAKALELATAVPTPGDFEVNGAHFHLRGWPLQYYAVEFSADLVNWNPLLDLQLIGGAAIEVRDPGSVGSDTRFYRAKRMP